MTRTPVEKQVFDLRDSSATLGNYSVFSLRRLIASGAIRAVRLGGRVFIPRAELERITQFGVGQPRRNGGRAQ
jgi:excisionase family DNA binding protein